eukprot:TRINITY_DN14103_c0_g1_i1.p1 TRINITY_DN14103_c0_g1~~TRINITY_DN14103_c0_g1_i1.p1  ORF type:complete len:285 (+),score=48.49 TRINITY_DN14103_c0_g1_i1:88-942(+)
MQCRMLKVAVILITLAVVCSAVSIGDRLLRDYTEYISLPDVVTNATAEGWEPITGECDPNLGIAYAWHGTTPTKDYPMILYFTDKGQAAGVGVYAFGDIKQKLVTAGFWQPVSNSTYMMSMTFRVPGSLCNGVTSSLVLGDQLVINQNSLAYSIPLLEADAIDTHWTRGSCFSGMGYHYFYDLTMPQGGMSWEAENLLPIVPMYFNGSINAFFFASSVVQQSFLAGNMWEPVPLPDFLMCKNWCDSNCTFHDTAAWSTLHIYMNNYKTVTCPDDCKIACCAKSV